MSYKVVLSMPREAALRLIKAWEDKDPELIEMFEGNIENISLTETNETKTTQPTDTNPAV